MGLVSRSRLTPRREKLPWGLMGMLVMVAVVERGIALRAREFESVGGCWGESAARATHEGTRAEVLIFGDSLSKFGLQPRVISEQTGLKTYNLAGYAAPPSYNYFMLRRVLAAGGRPRAIVINLQPFYSPDYHRRFGALFAEFITPREAFDLAQSERDPSFFGWILTKRYVPSSHHRDAIRKRILQGLKGEPSNLAELTAAFRRNWSRNRGGHAQQTEPHAPETVSNDRLSDYSGLIADPVSSDRIHGPYVDRFLDLADSQKIPVYLVMPPMLPALQALRDSGGYSEHEALWVQGILDRHPHVTVLEARHAGYDHRQFADDLIHINARGAEVLSADIGNLLRRRLVENKPEARWISLPRYHEPDAAIPLETFAESQAQVRGRSVRR